MAHPIGWTRKLNEKSGINLSRLAELVDSRSKHGEHLQARRSAAGRR
jgi:hypothetical protein